jgi:hypothetical protein
MPVFSGHSREQLRRMYLEAWRKFSARAALEPLEAQIAAVIAEHREYLPWLESGSALEAEFGPDARENPFLHLGLHLAIREQVATDRPRGIAQALRTLAARCADAHAAEHALAEVLAETLAEARRSGLPPDEQAYLASIERLLSR